MAILKLKINGKPHKVDVDSIPPMLWVLRDHPVQKAWLAHDVLQCGYCQAGQMVSAAFLLEEN